MDWWEMMGASPMPPAQAEPGYNAMMQQDPMQDLIQYNRPAANPQELEKRTTGWATLAQRFEQDPNLQRALFLTGAMLAQPVRPGQTTAGNIANAGVVGMNAYTQGKAAEIEQMAKMAREGREERRLGLEEAKLPSQIGSMEAGTAHTKATTATVEAARPGVEAEAKVKAGTADDLIQTARLTREKAALAQSDAEKDSILKDLTRANEALRAEAQGPNISRLVQQELDKNDAVIGQLKAKSKQETAKAGVDELTAQIVQGLPPEEQKDFALKRGKYGTGSQSAIVQQRDMYGDIYDKLPENDPMRQQMSKDQFVLRQLQSGKQSSALKELTDYVTKMEGAGLTPDPQIVDMWTKAAKMTGESKAPGAAAPAPGGPAPAPAATKGGPAVKGKIQNNQPGATQASAVRIAGQEDFDKLPSGSYFIGPDGKTRRKP